MQPPAIRNAPRRAVGRSSGRSCRGDQSIAIVGASVRAAAESARRAGYRVTGMDRFGDTDTKRACHQHLLVPSDGDLSAILQGCRGLPVIQVGDLAEPRDLLQALADKQQHHHGTEFDIQVGDADQMRDVGNLERLAVESGMRFPAYRLLRRAEETPSEPCGGRWLVKDPQSCGGLGVRWHSTSAGYTIREGQILQRWVAGRSYGATWIGDGRRAGLLGVCRSLFTRQADRPFLYAGSLGPVAVERRLSQTLRRLGSRVVESTGSRGLFNADFVVDRDGIPWLLEINPRWSGSSELVERRLIAQGTTESLFGWMIEMMRGTTEAMVREIDSATESESESHPVFLKRIIYASRNVHFQRPTIDRLLRDGESLHDIPEDGTRIERGHPVCTVISTIDSHAKDPMRRHRVLQREIKLALMSD